MRVFDQIFAKLGYVPKQKKRVVREFTGAAGGRLFGSWNPQNLSADAEIRSGLTQLRARSRYLGRNDPYVKKFFRMTRTNVVGARGIRFQSMVEDESIKAMIENEFKEWSKKGNCDVTGKYSFRDIQNMSIVGLARDGEVVFRKVRGFENQHSFALQMLEPDHLDETYSDLYQGNSVKMGVELDQWSRPIGYHILNHHPGDTIFRTVERKRVRFPSDEILHLYLPDRISQTRGVPWTHAVLRRMPMLDGYEEAELVAARIAAAKGGFYTTPHGQEYTGQSVDDNQPIVEVEAGVFETLPAGWSFQPFDPQHPTSAFDSFVRCILMSVASGLDVSYPYLANDLANVNFSSIRAGVIDERDVWRDLQSFMIEHLLAPIFNEWLAMLILSGRQALNMVDFKSLSASSWRPRGWQWVDPEKDLKSKQRGINMGVDSAGSVAAEQGKDIEEVYQELQKEKGLREKYGIEIENSQE